MKPAWVVYGLLGMLAVPASLALAEGGLLRQADGSTPRITDLGNGIGIVTDPHGVHSPTPLPSQPGMERLHPPAAYGPGTLTPFGTPVPPNQLTPAPTLPFNPNRPLLPAPLAPPSRTGPGSGRFGG